MDYERRSLCLDDCEIRAEGGDTPTIKGYAALFNRKSQDLGGFVEIIEPGAFKASLDGGADVRALVEHDPKRIIGRRSAGTLVVEEDKRGLKVTITPPDTSVGRDIVESIRRGDVSQMSFGFTVVTEEWSEAGKIPLHTLRQVDLRDVSPVSFPVYRQTTVSVRSMEQWRSDVLGRAAAARRRRRIDLTACD